MPSGFNDLEHLARDRGDSLHIAVYRWLLAYPAGIVTIIGSQNANRIMEAPQALEVERFRHKWYDVFTAVRSAPLP